MAYTMDSTLGELLNDARVLPILEQQMPGMAANPMVAMVKGMSLNSIVAIPQAAQMGFTREKAEQMLTEVNKRV
jgi:hypothetical protein